MFQFSGFAPDIIWWHGRPCRVAPFGDPRIKGYLHLPAACRSLSRPSSPLRAKASSVRPLLLSLALGSTSQLNPVFPLAFLLKLCFFQHVNELNPFRPVAIPGIEPRNQFTIYNLQFTISSLHFGCSSLTALAFLPPGNSSFYSLMFLKFIKF